MAYHVGDCPKCGARLLVEYTNAMRYEDIDLTSSTINLTYIVKCWKCGAIIESTICSNIDEQPMEVNVKEEDGDYLDACYDIVPTRDLSDVEKKRDE